MFISYGILHEVCASNLYPSKNMAVVTKIERKGQIMVKICWPMLELLPFLDFFK